MKDPSRRVGSSEGSYTPGAGQEGGVAYAVYQWKGAAMVKDTSRYRTDGTVLLRLFPFECESYRKEGKFTRGLDKESLLIASFCKVGSIYRNEPEIRKGNTGLQRGLFDLCLKNNRNRRGLGERGGPLRKQASTSERLHLQGACEGVQSLILDDTKGELGERAEK